MSKPFCINPKEHKITVIQRESDLSIIVHSLLRDGVWSKNSLTKIEKVISPNNVEKYRYRGFTLPDLLTIKRHWATILKAMVSECSTDLSAKAVSTQKKQRPLKTAQTISTLPTYR